MLSSIQQVHAGQRPDLAGLVATFTDIVTGKDFPCIYTQLPISTNQIYFDLVEDRPGSDNVANALVELCTKIRSESDAVAVIFVAESAAGSELSLADDFSRCRRIIRAVERRNIEHGSHSFSPVSPQHPLWSLTLEGIGLFVNFSSPRHRHRRSRVVGPLFTVIAQARASFDKVSRSGGARQRIRSRLSVYDTVPPHPCLGAYGHQDNREALQYFLGDGQEAWDPTQGSADG